MIPFRMPQSEIVSDQTPFILSEGLAPVPLKILRWEFMEMANPCELSAVILCRMPQSAICPRSNAPAPSYSVPPQVGAVLRHLHNEAFYFVQGLVDSSLRTYMYQSGQTWYIKFCCLCNFLPIPLSEQGLCSYVSHLANETLTRHTIKCLACGTTKLRWNSRSIPRADNPSVTYVQRGIKLNEAKLGIGSFNDLVIDDFRSPRP